MKIISVEKVLQNKKLPSWILKAAFELNVGGYLPTGEFFEKLDDEEVQHMRICAKNVSTENFKQFTVESFNAEKNLENLSLLCFLLALGEGDVEVTPDSLSDLLESLFLLISIEYLYRSGEVDVIRENYSICSGDRAVVKARRTK
jgi:hypothetical protein